MSLLASQANPALEGGKTDAVIVCDLVTTQGLQFNADSNHTHTGRLHCPPPHSREEALPHLHSPQDKVTDLLAELFRAFVRERWRRRAGITSWVCVCMA